tara:strand:- start:21300 stop:21785 length:486 start_codon:yes stop_codon:yes gene_type:complete
MEDRKYCIVVLDNTSGIEKELEVLISEPVNIVTSQSETVVIATFESTLSPARIKKALNMGNGRSFFVFELNANSCSTHVDEEHLHEFLFRDLDIESEVVIEDENREFLEEYNKVNLSFKYDEKALLNLNEEERELLMDKLLSNARTLTNNQKKTLSFLASL